MNWLLKIAGLVATLDNVLDRLKRVEAELEILQRRKPYAVMMMDEQDSYDARSEVPDGES